MNLTPPLNQSLTLNEALPFIRNHMSDIVDFAREASQITLRRYQVDAARTIIDSVRNQLGLSIVVMFPRQSGKNEIQAQIEAYLLTLLSKSDTEIVKVSPTWKPQSLNAMRRLERVLSRNWITKYFWKKESGYIFRLGQARIFFLSGGGEANIVGATASTLLEVDEAQDVMISKFDKDIAPMAASTNATRVFWGTAWTSQTLLARELRASRRAQETDKVRRVFVLTADEVAQEVPAYGLFVAQQIAARGRQHPMIRTQFFSEEIDSSGGLFPPERRALMQGSHPRRLSTQPGKVYAFLIDVAGEETGDEQETPPSEPAHSSASADQLSVRRDASALTIVELDLSTLNDDLLKAPTYKVVERKTWVGAGSAVLYAELKALAGLWRPRKFIVDATGIGAGLASFLGRAFPDRVIPYTFTAVSKSKLGWNFLSICDTGRFKDWDSSLPTLGVPETAHPMLRNDLKAAFWRQVDSCVSEVQPGLGEMLRWGTPNGARDPQTGEYLHDDLLISAALCAVLDDQKWSISSPTPAIIQARDPLKELDKGY